MTHLHSKHTQGHLIAGKEMQKKMHKSWIVECISL